MPPSGPPRGPVTVPEVRDLPRAEREGARPLVKACFKGFYRWHANRCLRDVETVRTIRSPEGIVALTILELLAPEAGYVTYVMVDPAHRLQGLGAALLDDALVHFRHVGAEVVYAAVGEQNEASRRLFLSRGFKAVERKELGYREGGLGAWGLRSQMRLVPGELLLGLRLRPGRDIPSTAPASRVTS